MAWYNPFTWKADSTDRDFGTAFPIALSARHSTLAFDELIYNTQEIEKKGYSNPIVKACVDLISRNAARVPVITRYSENLSEARFAPMLERWDDKVEQMFRQYLVFGVATAQILITPGQVDLMPLPAVDIDVEVDRQTGKLKVVKFLQADSEKNRAFGEGAESGIHEAFFFIDKGAAGDPYRAKSPIATMSDTIEAHNMTIKWLRQYLKRGATFGNYISPDVSRNNTTIQFNAKTKEQFEKKHEDQGGVEGAGKNLLWDVPIKVHPLGGSAREAQIREMGDQLALYITSGYGVPAQLVGLKGSQTYANFENAQRGFFKMSLLPMLERFYAELSKALAVAVVAETKRLNRVEVDLKPDHSKIPIIREEAQQEYQRINTLNMMTPNEKRREMNRISGAIEGEPNFLTDHEDGNELPKDEPSPENEGTGTANREEEIQRIKAEILAELQG